MTVQADFQLNDDSRRVLRSLKGKRWRLATGDPLAEKPRHYFAWNDVIIATDSGEARIHTNLVERDFEGYEEEYAQLSVHSDSRGLPEAQRNGHIYFQHAGEVITEVYLIRITITQVMDGVPTWTYSTDYGVVFGLSEGAVAVCKTSHHSEALDVSFADSVDELEIDDRVDEWDWDNELGKEYESKRELIPIG